MNGMYLEDGSEPVLWVPEERVATPVDDGGERLWLNTRTLELEDCFVVWERRRDRGMGPPPPPRAQMRQGPAPRWALVAGLWLVAMALFVAYVLVTGR